MEEIHDIRPPIEMTSFWTQFKPYILVLGTILAIVLVFFLYKKLKKKPNNVPIIYTLTPYEEAINELALARRLIGIGNDKALALALSQCIRSYIEKTYNLKATEKTTEEFLYEQQTNTAFEEKTLFILTTFLQLSDLAKFAKKELNLNEQEELYQRASCFLESAKNEKRSI